MAVVNSQCYKRVTHIIFDLDGTLIDTEAIYESLFHDLIAKFGQTIPASLKFKFKGSPAPVALGSLIKELQLPVTRDELYSDYRKLCMERFTNVGLMKGAERLIRHFQRHNVPMAIATSSDRDSVRLKISGFPELFELIHHTMTANDILNGKPAPDIYLLAAKRFPDRPKPECCLVFEDSPNGVKAARTANMQCVMTPDYRVTDEERSEATIVLDSLDDFQPELFGLPPFTK